MPAERTAARISLLDRFRASTRPLLEYESLVLATAAGLGLWALWFAASRGTAALGFEQWSLAQYTQFLTPLFLIALFIERALEIFVTPWRGGGVREAKARAAAAERNAPPDVRAAEVERHQAAAEAYRRATRRLAFTGGLVAGVVISAAGVRVLEPLLAPSQMDPAQAGFLRVVDVLVTGALLGGGADGLHKIVALLTDFLERTRERVNTAAPPAS